jgi:hypothetical protein
LPSEALLQQEAPKSKQSHNKFTKMKKFLFALVAGFLSALAAPPGVYAHNPDLIARPQMANTMIHKDSIAPVSHNAGLLANISGKAQKEFTRTFKISGENWSVIADGYVAAFSSDDVSTIVYYSKRGSWTGTMKTYTENKMPRSVRDIVKRQYYDFKITLVNEVENTQSNQIPTYVVHLEDAKNILLVRVNDNVMEEWQKYDKQQ